MTKNQLKTVMLLALLTGLLLAIGGMLGGSRGITIGLVIGLTVNFISYWFSDRIVLYLYRAQLAGKEHHELLDMVADLARKAAISTPRVYVINTPQMNAFATGRNEHHAVVACTTGILQALDKDELRAVLGHEISHITNHDILISTIAAGIASVISYVAFMARWAAIFGGFGGRNNDGPNPIELIVLAIVTPIIAMLIQFAISRSREYLADEHGARLTRAPLKLASALEKISSSVKHHPFVSSAATSSTAHLFISNPFSGRSFLHLLSTHPPTELRVKKLREMKI